MQKTTLLILFFFLVTGVVQAQHSHIHGRKIVFPDIPGFLTLKCDFHIHTVFSDGNVWPSIRIEEAEKDGLDAVSMTEHIEYQPHIKDIPHPDRNRSFEVASQAAQNSSLLVVSGSEITRSMPPGHNNAIFLTDANKLIQDDAKAVFQEAHQQGAFVFWNHPNWTAQRKDGMATLTDMHSELIREGLLHGIEVVNDITYSSEALQIALDHNLTIMGTSDIHGLVDWQFEVPQGGHRPITLVFAKEKSPEAIKEALFEGRTVAYFRDNLIGREPYLVPLIEASLSIDSVAYQGNSQVLDVMIRNSTNVEFTLENLSEYTLHANSDILKIAPQGITHLQVKTLETLEACSLTFRVLNAILAPKTHPTITLTATVD